MSYALQLTCDHEDCPARWPERAEALTFEQAREASARAGWAERNGGHVCPGHARPGEVAPCQTCGQPIPPGQRRTAYCSPRCAFEGAEVKKAALRAERTKGGAEQGRSGPQTPETAQKLARSLGEHALARRLAR